MVPQKSGRALLIGFGILSLIFIGLLKSGCPSGIFVISFLLFITGFLVSGAIMMTVLALAALFIL